MLQEKEYAGRLVALRVPVEDLTVREYVALTYYLLFENLDEKGRNKLQITLETPPPGYKGSLAGTMWDDDDMLAAYESGGEH